MKSIGNEISAAYEDGFKDGRSYEKTLISLVEEWAEGKDLLHKENIEKQFMKFIEEVFEFKTELDLYQTFGYTYPNYINMVTEMGDIFVTLIILCKQLDMVPVKCLELAYKKIKDKKGKTINGTFVKEEDLHD